MPSVRQDPHERVVITGMGAVTSLGPDVESTWDAIVSGKDSITPIRDTTMSGYEQFHTTVGAPILDFDIFAGDMGERLGKVLKPKDLRRIHRSAQFVVWAASEALSQANLLNDNHQIDPDQVNVDRVGMRMGTSIGGANEIGEVHNVISDGTGKRVSFTPILQILPERVATVSSMAFKARGPVSTNIGACATGNMNIIAAADVLTHKKRRADIMIAGSSDAVLSPVGIAIFEGAGAVDKNTETDSASRPFYTDQAGLVMGEGAGVLVLETLANARRRGAVILAELAGYAETSDAHHETEPSGEGAERAMREALADAGIRFDDKLAINAHATGTKGDAIEMQAIANVFNGKYVDGATYRKEQIIGISSVKGAIGHTLGAASAIESILSIKTLLENKIPPSLKMSSSPIPETEGWPMSPDEATVAMGGLDAVLNNSFGFGGLNAVTIYTKVRE